MVDSDNEIQKFLKVYKELALKLDLDGVSKNATDIKCSKLNVANLLARCLQCINIDSNILYGDELENGEPHYWNQVKIDGNWYNVDLAIDIPYIKKKKTEYCLVDDEDFYEFHKLKSGEKHYCKDEYNYKFVKTYIRSGVFKEQLLVSYIETMKQKLKKIFASNKKGKILSLPDSNNTKINRNNLN